MKRFQHYVAFREAQNNNADTINAIFQQAEQEIDQLFIQFYHGTANMVKSYERAGLPENLKRSIFKNLQQIADLVKGTASGEESTRPQQSMTGVNQMRAMGDATIHNLADSIKSMISEVSAVSGLGSPGAGPMGKPAYDFKSTLANIKRQVIEKMERLRAAVLDKMGAIDDTLTAARGARQNAGQARNILQAQQKQQSNTPSWGPQ